MRVPKKSHKAICTSSKGYITVYLPSHPRADKCGRVFEHIVVWENAHQKSVPKGFVIHHINGIKNDNRIENLLLLSNGEHTALHNSRRKISQKTREKISASAKARLANPKNHPRYKSVDIKNMILEIASGKTVESVCLKYGINKTTYYKKIKTEESVCSI